MNHRADVQRLGRGDAGEIRLAGCERTAHAQLGQHGCQLELALLPEPGQRERHPATRGPTRQGTEPGGEIAGQRGQRPVGEHDGHDEPAAAVRQQHGLVPVAADIPQLLGQPHHPRSDRRARPRALGVERGVTGGSFGERMRPRRVQVDGVDQDQPGQRVERARGDQVADLALGLLGDQVVDLQPGRVRGADEIGLADADRGGLAQHGGELGEQLQARLDPHRVRRPENDPVAGQASQPGRQHAEAVRGGLRPARVQRRCHLGRGLPPRAAERHPQRRRNAGGREHEIAAIGCEQPVQGRTERFIVFGGSHRRVRHQNLPSLGRVGRGSLGRVGRGLAAPARRMPSGAQHRRAA